MWVLVLMVIVTGGVTVTTVPASYSSEQRCNVARDVAVKALGTERPGSYAKGVCVPAS